MKCRVKEINELSQATKPYVEASTGIGNILRVLRVDFVKRLTYLDHPYTSGYSIRLSFKMDF